MPTNEYCSINQCIAEHGEVRLLPHTSDPLGGNDILCRHCFHVVLRDRRERNLQLSKEAQYALPTWESLKVYDPASWTEESNDAPDHVPPDDAVSG